MENNQTDIDAFTEDSEFGDIIVGVFLAMATALLGGYLCGLIIDQFASVGSISLWGLGFISGLAASKLVRTQSTSVALMLIAACVFAFVFAEVCWIHWNIKGAETWGAALAKFPIFLKEFRIDAFIAGIFTLFGAQSAYRQTARRRRPV